MFLRIVITQGSNAPQPLQASEDSDAFYIHNSHVTAAIKKRPHAPSTYCEQTTTGLEIGYRTPANSPVEDYLCVQFLHDGTLIIKRDTRATLPLFYGFSQGHFVASNDYAEVVQHMPKLTLDLEDIGLAISPDAFQAPTLWREVHILGADRTLTLRPNSKPTIHLNRQRPWNSNADLPKTNPRIFLSLLSQKLEDNLATYASSQPIGFELGGIDSSTLPLYLSEYYQDIPWHGATILYNENFPRVTHLKKMHAIKTRSPQSRIHIVPSDPHVHTLWDSFYQEAPIYPYQGPTYIHSLVVEKFASENMHVVFNGFGSDELFEHAGSSTDAAYASRSYEERSKILPSCFTPRFRELLYLPKSAPPPLCISSSLLPNTAASQYADRGIWHASPFLDAELFNASQGLPWAFRKDKRILKLFYQLHNFPNAIYDTYPNENINYLYDSAIATTQFHELLLDCMQSSFLVKIGYLDADQLLRAYTDFLQGSKDKDATLVSYCLPMILTIEHNLRLATRTGQWDYRPVLLSR